MQWQVYYMYEPWDDLRADRRAALIAYTMYQMNRGKGSQNITVAEFMAMINRPIHEAQQAPDEVHAQRLMAGARAHNVRVRRERERKAKG